MARQASDGMSENRNLWIGAAVVAAIGGYLYYQHQKTTSAAPAAPVVNKPATGALPPGPGMAGAPGFTGSVPLTATPPPTGLPINPSTGQPWTMNDINNLLSQVNPSTGLTYTPNDILAMNPALAPLLNYSSMVSNPSSINPSAVLGSLGSLGGNVPAGGGSVGRLPQLIVHPVTKRLIVV